MTILIRNDVDTNVEVVGMNVPFIFVWKLSLVQDKNSKQDL
jgi:hypothetical protein